MSGLSLLSLKAAKYISAVGRHLPTFNIDFLVFL